MAVLNSIGAQVQSQLSEQRNLAEFSVVDAIANWCEALYGTIQLQEAVEHLVRGLGAEAGMLVRTNLRENRSVRVAVHDGLGKRTGLPLQATYADAVFGNSLKNARCATLWLGSEHADVSRDDTKSEFCRWHEGRQMNEFATLVLAAGPTTRDHVELHFKKSLSAEALSALNDVLPAMARTWSSRKVGLITRSVINHRSDYAQHLDQSVRRPILGVANPARLSRAEFRVCMLLSQGLSVAGVCSELSLAEATVRSHLRNIYAKSDSANLAELIFRLIGPETSLPTSHVMSA